MRKPEEYKYYSTQRPISIGTFPKDHFKAPIRLQNYDGRLPVEGGAFRAWGEVVYDTPLSDGELRSYELRPSRNNPDIRRQMDAQAQVVGKWEDAHRVPDQKRLTWFYPDFGSYVVKEYITPEQLADFARGVERQEAARAHKEAKRQPPIAEQLKAAQREAQENKAPDGPKRKPLTGATDRRTVMEKKREQDFANQEALRLSGVFNTRSPPAPGTGKGAGQGKGAAPRLPEPGTGGAVTKKRRRPIHLHVMVSEEEQALIRERMAEAGIRNMGAYIGKWPSMGMFSMLTCHLSRSWCRSSGGAPTI